MKNIYTSILLIFFVSFNATAQTLSESINWTKIKLEKYSNYGYSHFSTKQTIERTNTPYIIKFVQYNYIDENLSSKLINTVNLRTVSQAVNIFNGKSNDDILLTISTINDLEKIKTEFTCLQSKCDTENFTKYKSTVIIFIPKKYESQDNIIERIKNSLEYIIKQGGGKKELF